MDLYTFGITSTQRTDIQSFFPLGIIESIYNTKIQPIHEEQSIGLLLSQRISPVGNRKWNEEMASGCLFCSERHKANSP